MTKMKFMTHFFLLLGASSFHLYGSPRPYFLILNSSFCLILIREYHDIPNLSSFLYYIWNLYRGGGIHDHLHAELSFPKVSSQPRMILLEYMSIPWTKYSPWEFICAKHESFSLEKYWFIPKMGQLRHLFSFGLLYLPSLPS